jgi:hypothetical protein
MALFASEDEHAANPPATWRVVKIAPRHWVLHTAADGWLGTFATRKQATEAKSHGFGVDLYDKERRWYAGERVEGWKPYSDPSFDYRRRQVQAGDR